MNQTAPAANPKLSLWDELLKMKEKSTKIVTPPKVKKIRPSSLPWQNQALVLIVQEVTCQCCGRRYTTPNSAVLLKAEHPLLGLHYSDITKAYPDPHEVFRDLPMVEEYREGTVPQCQFCWNLGAVIDLAKKAATEVTL